MCLERCCTRLPDTQLDPNPKVLTDCPNSSQKAGFSGPLIMLLVFGSSTLFCMLCYAIRAIFIICYSCFC